jgi:hypothetical protein
VKTQYLLLVAYATFVVAALAYWGFTQQWEQRSRLEPEVLDTWHQEAGDLTDIAVARQRTLALIDALEKRESHNRLTSHLHRYFVIFAVLATLPLAAYAGQSMRDKLFVTRPVHMPRIVYWTLFGVSTRATAVRYMWLSIVLAFVSSAVALITPIGFLGLFSLITAYLYQYAIEWVDNNAYWANQTLPPFPLGPSD